MSEYPMPKVCPVRMPTKGKSLLSRSMQAFRRRQWTLCEDYQDNIPWFNGNRFNVLVPAPMRFDFASVPRVFWFALDPVGLLLIGSIFHDWAYRYGGLLISDNVMRPHFTSVTRSEADELLYLITKDVNDMAILARLAQGAVRIGGFSSWKADPEQIEIDYRDHPGFATWIL